MKSKTALLVVAVLLLLSISTLAQTREARVISHAEPAFGNSDAIPANDIGTRRLLESFKPTVATTVGTLQGGVTSIGTIDSVTKSANGLVISGSSLIAQTADASFPGLVSTGAQTFAGNKAATGTWTFGSGTFTGPGLPSGVGTPNLMAIVDGTSTTPSTSGSPALSISRITNQSYTGGSGQVTIHATKAGNSGAPMEILSIWGRQTGAIDYGGIVGEYIRVIAEVAGTASSHFAGASTVQKFVATDATSWEFDIDNERTPATDSATDYGTAGDRSMGVLIVGYGNAKHTAALVIGTGNGATSSFFTGIDILTNSIDTSSTFRAIRIPNGTSIYSRNGANNADVNILGVNGADQIVLGAGGNSVSYGGPIVMGTGVWIAAGSTTFASLPALSNGSLLYCSNCKKTTPCTGSGTGAIAKRLNSAWDCN